MGVRKKGERRGGRDGCEEEGGEKGRKGWVCGIEGRRV